jgi:hypothetical protein
MKARTKRGTYPINLLVSLFAHNLLQDLARTLDESVAASVLEKSGEKSGWHKDEAPIFGTSTNNEVSSLPDRRRDGRRSAPFHTLPWSESIMGLHC